MLHNLSLRNITISTSFLKLLIWSNAYLKIILSILINGFLSFKDFFMLDFTDLGDLWVKGCVFINILIVFYLDFLKL